MDVIVQVLATLASLTTVLDRLPRVLRRLAESVRVPLARRRERQEGGVGKKED